jgi:hypothetical protein
MPLTYFSNETFSASAVEAKTKEEVSAMAAILDLVNMIFSFGVVSDNRLLSGVTIIV